MRFTRLLVLAAAAVLSAPELPAAPPETIPQGPLRYNVTATKPRLNRKLLGPASSHVQGVPAEPVDSFVWSGEGSVPIEGQLTLVIDPTREVGLIQASWHDEHGQWTYTQSRFLHPEHESGVRMGSSVSWTDGVINEGAAPNVYLHGDTGAGQPVLPTLFAFLATWGPADVTLNGEPFINPFEYPAPRWAAHVMVTEGVRFPDGSVRTVDDGIFHPSQGAWGKVEPGDLEVHLVFHDEKFPLTDSIPPLFSFFYHLVFEDVAIEIVQNTGTIPVYRPPSGRSLGRAPQGRRR